MRDWVRRWLGIEESDTLTAEGLTNCVHVISELQAEVARLKVERYVPPQQPEPERKVIKTRSMSEFNAILERELMESEA